MFQSILERSFVYSKVLLSDCVISGCLQNCFGIFKRFVQDLGITDE